MELEATHVTTRLIEPLLVCELYPGVLVVDTFTGPFTVLEYGSRVKRLPSGQDRVFHVTERTAELAAKLYDAQIRASAFFSEPWPPPDWSPRTSNQPASAG